MVELELLVELALLAELEEAPLAELELLAELALLAELELVVVELAEPELQLLAVLVLAKYNATPTQFQWTKDADTILAKIDRARRALTRRIDK